MGKVDDQNSFRAPDDSVEVRTELTKGRIRVCAPDSNGTMRSVGVIGKEGELKFKGCPIFIGKTACDECTVHEPPAHGGVTPYIGGLIGW